MPPGGPDRRAENRPCMGSHNRHPNRGENSQGKCLDITAEKHHSIAMNLSRSKVGLLAKELIVTLLVFLLVTLSLDVPACAATCDSKGLSDSHPCSLNMPTPDHESTVPPCCIGETLPGGQYVPSRKKSEASKIFIPLTAADQISPNGDRHLISRPARPDSWSFSKRSSLLPIFVLHSVFLV
jgi:hypothetical protein